MSWRRLELLRCASVGARVTVLGDVFVLGPGRVELGDDVTLDGRLAPIELRTGGPGVLRLGDGCVVEGGVSLEAQERIEVGPRCRLRAFAKVMDNHFHPISGDRHQRPQSKPVVLDVGVDVGRHCIVLPGAHLEAGVVLGPAVVIGRRVKAGMTLAGSPPKVVPAGSLPVDEAPVFGPPSLRTTFDAVAAMTRDSLAGVTVTADRALRVLDRARARVLLRRADLGGRVCVVGRIDAALEGDAAIGARTMFFGGPVPTSVRVARGAALRIGEACHFNYGVTIDASREVRIGARCMFGSHVRLVDAPDAPIVLGDDVWVAHGAVIAPGVAIGSGAVISAGAVVKCDVPAGKLAIGNPARVMSQALST